MAKQKPKRGKRPLKRRRQNKDNRAAAGRPSPNPGNTDVIASALRLQQNGDLNAAEDLYRQVLKTEPGNPDAWHLLGMTLFALNQHQQAIECLQSALTSTPNQSVVLTNLGVVFRGSGQLDEAQNVLERAVSLTPNSVNALNNLGTVYFELGNLRAAEAKFQNVLSIDAESSQAAMNLGNVWQQQGRYLDAESVYRKLTLRLPNDPLLLNNLGEALRNQSKWKAAVEAFEPALSINPNSVETRLNLARSLTQACRWEDAKKHFAFLIEQNPGLAQPHHYLGKLYFDLGDIKNATNCIERAVGLDPKDVYALSSLGFVYLEAGELSQAEACFRSVIEMDPTMHQAHGCLLFLMSGNIDIGQQELFEEHKRWGKLHGSVEPLKSRDQWLTERSNIHKCDRKERRLRIGYVSPDLRRHAVASFFMPVLQSHDSEKFETFCYAEVGVPDETTEELSELSNHWRTTTGMSDEQVARQVMADNIDILVDLAGHTARNRLRAFAFRPAPIQITWMGYPNTSGLTTIDYRLTCETQNPIGEDSFHTERLVRMPRGSFCFARPKHAPTPSELPAIKNGHITFGSLHRPEKISKVTHEIWAGVLQSCPGSRLNVFNTRFTDESARMLINDLSKLGIESDRIQIRNSLEGEHYFHVYDQVDIALDVTPWAGGTTTLEALWMGVPVIAYYGNRRSSRSTAAVMKNVGHESLIARSEGEYRLLAQQLSCDIPRLTDLRKSLPAHVEATIFDGASFTSDLETSFRKIWHDWCDL